MPKHDYTAKDALTLLIKKIETVSTDLAKRIQFSTDMGKDIPAEEKIMLEANHGKPKKRYYRKHVAYTDDEALAVAMMVLESHLIESRLLVNAAHGEFKKVGLAPAKKLKPIAQAGALAETFEVLDMGIKDEISEVLSLGEPKTITIESEPETVKEKKNLSDLPFEPIDEEQLRSLRENFNTLKALTNFQEMHHGKPY